MTTEAAPMNLLTCADEWIPRLYRDVLDAPTETHPKLVLADRLEEVGESDRAEFIRGGIELSGIDLTPEDCDKVGNIRTRMQSGAPVRLRAKTAATRFVVLKDRLLFLFQQHGQSWFGGEIGTPCERCQHFTHGCPDHYDGSGKKGRIVRDLTLRVPTGPCISCGGDRSLTFPEGQRRTPEHGNAYIVGCPACDRTGHAFATFTIANGFVQRIECTMAQFMEERCERCGGQGWYYDDHGGNIGVQRHCNDCRSSGYVNGLAAKVFAREPVTEVVTDRKPANRLDVNSSWYWFRDVRGENGTESHLPDAIFNLLPGGSKETIGLPFSPGEAAQSALNSALCQYGRTQGRKDVPSPSLR